MIINIWISIWMYKYKGWYGSGVSSPGIILGLPFHWPIHKRIEITIITFSQIHKAIHKSNTQKQSDNHTKAISSIGCDFLQMLNRHCIKPGCLNQTSKCLLHRFVIFSFFPRDEMTLGRVGSIWCFVSLRKAESGNRGTRQGTTARLLYYNKLPQKQSENKPDWKVVLVRLFQPRLTKADCKRGTKHGCGQASFGWARLLYYNKGRGGGARAGQVVRSGLGAGGGWGEG